MFPWECKCRVYDPRDAQLVNKQVDYQKDVYSSMVILSLLKKIHAIESMNGCLKYDNVDGTIKHYVK